MIFRAKGLVKQYNNRKVLDIADMGLERGTVYGLLGPNGSGKTTLLKILAFLDTPSAGSLFFQGQKVSKNPVELKQHRRRVVLIDQHPILFTTTVFKNVEFGLKVRKIPKSRRRPMIMAALDRVGMADFALHPAHRLSGGETQRVAIARALALDPEVLLCDEPTSSVDALHQGAVMEILKQINQTRGITVVFTTHEQFLAENLAQKILFLHKGRFAQPASENQFSAQMVFKSSRAAVFRIAEGFSLRLPLSSNALPGDKARITIHPEKIQIISPDQADTADEAENNISAKVVRISEENSHIRLKVDAGASLLLSLSHARYREINPRVGDTLTLHIPLQAVQLLDDKD